MMGVAPDKVAQEGFLQGVTREPFLRICGYVEKGSSTLHTYYSLFKFVNPAEEADGPGENGGVFSFCGDRNNEGDKPQLFKPAQRNCLEWKKVKISNNKAAFATFYANEANKNKTREPIGGSVSDAYGDATGGPGASSQWGMHAL